MITSRSGVRDSLLSRTEPASPRFFVAPALARAGINDQRGPDFAATHLRAASLHAASLLSASPYNGSPAVRSASHVIRGSSPPG